MGTYALWVKKKSGKYFYPLPILDENEIIYVVPEKSGAVEKLKGALSEKRFSNLECGVSDIQNFLSTFEKLKIRIIDIS